MGGGKDGCGRRIEVFVNFFLGGSGGSGWGG